MTAEDLNFGTKKTIIDTETPMNASSLQRTIDAIMKKVLEASFSVGSVPRLCPGAEECTGAAVGVSSTR
jgi:hypothetical protein